MARRREVLAWERRAKQGVRRLLDGLPRPPLPDDLVEAERLGHLVDPLGSLHVDRSRVEAGRLRPSSTGHRMRILLVRRSARDLAVVRPAASAGSSRPSRASPIETQPRVPSVYLSACHAYTIGG